MNCCWEWVLNLDSEASACCVHCREEHLPCPTFPVFVGLSGEPSIGYPVQTLENREAYYV